MDKSRVIMIVVIALLITIIYLQHNKFVEFKLIQLMNSQQIKDLNGVLILKDDIYIHHTIIPKHWFLISSDNHCLRVHRFLNNYNSCEIHNFNESSEVFTFGSCDHHSVIFGKILTMDVQNTIFKEHVDYCHKYNEGFNLSLGLNFDQFKYNTSTNEFHKQVSLVKAFSKIIKTKHFVIGSQLRHIMEMGVWNPNDVDIDLFTPNGLMVSFKDLMTHKFNLFVEGGSIRYWQGQNTIVCSPSISDIVLKDRGDIMNKYNHNLIIHDDIPILAQDELSKYSTDNYPLSFNTVSWNPIIQCIYKKDL
jgi:hypothetical protein